MWAGLRVNLLRYLLCGHKEWFWNIFSKIISKDWILTSSPSANNTRYSDSWSFTNQLNKSRFTFGSRTFTTKHASFSKFWLAGPYYKWITILKQLVTIRYEFSKQNMITVNNKGLFQSNLNFYLCCRTLKCFFKICFYLLSKFSFNFIDPVARIIRKFLTGQIIKVKYSISNHHTKKYVKTYLSASWAICGIFMYLWKCSNTLITPSSKFATSPYCLFRVSTLKI